MATSTDDLPIALRRTRRTSTVPAVPSPPPKPLQTPPKKTTGRVRFSNPLPRTRLSSTGLTPMVRRTGLDTPTPSRRRLRRHSSPGPAKSSSASCPSTLTPGRRSQTPTRDGARHGWDLPISGEVHLLPLRQVLDGRIQRRLRRNGLSEEMNRLSAERRSRARETAAELERLRTEVRTRDQEIYALQNATIIVDTERVWALEAQVDELKHQLTARTLLSPVGKVYEWSANGGDPFGTPTAYDDDRNEAMQETPTEINTDRGMDSDDDYADADGDGDGLGDSTMTDADCETPIKSTNRAAMRGPLLTPPLTSPAAPVSAAPPAQTRPAPATPKTPSPLAAAAMANASCQTSPVDPEKESLKHELGSLRLELSKLTGTLESYTALNERLSSRIAASLPPCDVDPSSPHPSSSFPSSQIESRLDALLRLLSDRAATVRCLASSIADLGFPGIDASDMIASIASGFRAARLELEYLTPGEVTLPLTSHGAEVLDLLLTRLRELGKKSQEDDAAINEYHHTERSLRQQLSTRVDAMDALGAELARAERHVRERDTHIGELEASVGHLKDAVNGYVRDTGELEALVQRVESEARDAEAAHHARSEAHRRLLHEKDAQLRTLEAGLAAARAAASSLEDQLAAARAHGESLRSGRDARIAELRDELDRVSGVLRGVQATAARLRGENDELRGRMRRGRGVVAELEQAILRGRRAFASPPRGRERDIDGPPTPALTAVSGAAEAPEHVPYDCESPASRLSF